MQAIKVRTIETGEISEWTISKLLHRINEDNATSEYDYNESDWIEGFNETLEGEFYSLNDKYGSPLNNNAAGKGMDPNAVEGLRRALITLIDKAGITHRDRPDNYDPIAYAKLAEAILGAEKAIKSAELK